MNCYTLFKDCSLSLSLLFVENNLSQSDFQEEKILFTFDYKNYIYTF